MSNIKLRNIYRPPKHTNNKETIANFLDEICPYINKLAKANLNSIITSNLNLDLLKIEESEKIQSYFPYFTILDIMKKKIHKLKFIKIINDSDSAMNACCDEIENSLIQTNFKNIVRHTVHTIVS